MSHNLSMLLSSIQALPTKEARIQEIDSARDALLALRDALLDSHILHRDGVLTALEGWCSGVLSGFPELTPDDRGEVHRLAETLKIESFRYSDRESDDTLRSRCAAVINGQEQVGKWTHSYSDQKSDWSFTGALVQHGNNCFFEEAELDVGALFDSTLRGSVLKAFLYLVFFDHLHEESSFYHRPSWD